MSHGWKRCAGSVSRSLAGRSPGARPRHGYEVKSTSAEDSTLPGMSARPKTRNGKTISVRTDARSGCARMRRNSLIHLLWAAAHKSRKSGARAPVILKQDSNTGLPARHVIGPRSQLNRFDPLGRLDMTSRARKWTSSPDRSVKSQREEHHGFVRDRPSRDGPVGPSPFADRPHVRSHLAMQSRLLLL